MDFSKALKEYTAIVKGLTEEYCMAELSVERIRQDHLELDFFEDDELEMIIHQVNSNRIHKEALRKTMEQMMPPAGAIKLIPVELEEPIHRFNDGYCPHCGEMLHSCNDEPLICENCNYKSESSTQLHDAIRELIENMGNIVW